MKPLMSGVFAREKADTLSCAATFVDAYRGSATVDMFLVTRRWQIAPYVHRYPSPVGRLGHTPCQAPDFFLFNTGCYAKRRAFAQFAGNCVTRWKSRATGALSSSWANTFEGAETCNTLSGHRRVPSRRAGFSPLRPVATRWANRRFWAGRPGQARLLSRTAIRSRALPSEQPPISPIAKPTRNAADAAARTTTLLIATVRATCPGGLFHAIAAGSLPGQEKTDGKGQTCSTRS